MVQVGHMPRIVFLAFAAADAERASPYIAALRGVGLDVRVPREISDLDASRDTPSMFLLFASPEVVRDERVIALLAHYHARWRGSGAARFDTSPYLLLPFYLTYFPGLVHARNMRTLFIVRGSYARGLEEWEFTRDVEQILALTALPRWETMALAEPLERLGFTGWRTGATGWHPDGTRFIVPPVCPIDAGPCQLGSDPEVDPLAYDNELPTRAFTVESFRIGAYPVTVAEYACYLESENNRLEAENRSMGITWDASQLEPRAGEGDLTWEEQLAHPDHPVTCVSWAAAGAYAEWLGELTFQPWRLPSEIEWEKAARWDATSSHARVYPWGDTWDPARANTNEGGPGSPTPVGAYAASGDTSPYGLHDVVGNVYEWTSSLWDTAPGRAGIQELPGDDETYRMHVLRGGSWCEIPRFARAAFRTGFAPFSETADSGFRLAR